ncbi:alanyl-tRNA editing protein [Lichenihabitans sp. Uapishka_5]|uniref:alanyl-tRNA editing protein n=1 Tax=Lichenihabitans sp. Uapishka_5 TaxID=3037302 RepID=UPI0029E7EA7F|nr:alanyl-tRNA editing protein [Lichenihabitans sp. Uapishka_5]MDX7951400.1 alanyl-tRNA editing protein [Lichenihabitans sp. Uapishka_5]
MTHLVFRDDVTLRSVEAIVTAVEPDGGLQLDRTVFYPQGGGQMGDAGHLTASDGRVVPIATTRYGADKRTVVHVPAADAPPLAVGDAVVAAIDWDTRWKRMRIHTALHLLTVVLPYPVAGGAIGDGDGRLDFDIPDAGLDKADIAVRLNALIAQNAAVTSRLISDAALLADPGLVKTMSVKPPMGTGQVRLIEIAGLDLQPCGGTHVGHTGEIGPVEVTGIEKKGKQNRRVRIRLASA